MDSSLIVKHNALVNAGYSLSLVEQRLILLAIVQLREHTHEGQLDHIAFDKPINVDATSYIGAFKVNNNTAYKALKDACKNLFTRQFSYQEPRGKGVAQKTTRWVSDIAYIDDAATVEFTFAPAVLPLITYLKDQFTQYELDQVSGLTSSYAIRLYELLVAWRTAGGTPMFELSDFRKKLGVDESKYSRMGQFKEKVLDRAVNQINDYTDINVKYQQHKKGREITGFSFKFKIKKLEKSHLGTEEEQTDLPLKKHYTKTDLEKDSSLARPGETYEQALRRLNTLKN